MSISFDSQIIEKIEKICQIGEEYHRKGWVPATSGNFSFRVNKQCIAITISGTHKGYLNDEDFVLIDTQARPLEKNKKASAESLLHCLVYQNDSNCQSVLHTHSKEAVVLSLLETSDALRLKDYEILKAFSGIESHSNQELVPIFENDQDMNLLSQKILAYCKQFPLKYGFILRGHGFYTWGKSIEEANRHVEALQYLCETELLKRRSSGV